MTEKLLNLAAYLAFGYKFQSMITILSPAKRLNFESPAGTETYSQPDFVDRSELLINKLRKTSGKKLGELMNISKDLVSLNKERYENWSPDHQPSNSKQALLAFQGDVYIGLQAEDFGEEDLSFAQDHVRILSGLYGILKPLDLMQPYRLEMGTQLPVRRKKNLYDFWGDSIAEELNQAVEASGSEYLINLASGEYFGAVNQKKLNVPVITPDFLDWKTDRYKPIQFFLKKARGFMTRYIVEERVNSPEGLKEFNLEGYSFNEELSTDEKPVFTRRQD